MKKNGQCLEKRDENLRYDHPFFLPKALYNQDYNIYRQMDRRMDGQTYRQ